MRYLHYHYIVTEKIELKKDRIQKFCFKDEEEMRKIEKIEQEEETEE